MDNKIAEMLVDIGGLALAIITLLCIAGVVIYLVGRSRLFKKCGKEGWKAIIPIYSDYVFYCEICGLHWIWFVLIMACEVGATKEGYVGTFTTIVNGLAFYNFGIKCNKDKYKTLLLGALFEPFVTVYYGFANINYDPSIEVKQSGLF